MEEIKYFLVLEKRLGDYNIVDINKLDICTYRVANTVSSIDCFTSIYSEEELKESIERSNIVHLSYLTGNLKIVSEKKHNFKVLTKNMFNIIKEFQEDDMEFDREFKNKIFGIYKKIVECIFSDKDFINGMLERFKELLRNGSKKEIFGVIEELPYSKSRTIYLCIYDEVTKRKEEIRRLNEKLSDM